MDKKYIIGLIMGISLVFLLGAIKTINRCEPGDIGGAGTYQAQMSNDGRTVAVMDTRTGLVKVFYVRAGNEILSFNHTERFFKDKIAK